MKKILLFILLFPYFVKSETIKWVDKNELIEIGNKTEVLEDPQGNFSFADISSDDWKKKFIPSKSTNLILGYTESVFWIKFTLENTTHDNLMLEIAQAGLPVCDLYPENRFRIS